MKKEQQNNIYDLEYFTWPFHHPFFSHRQQMDGTKIPSCLNTLRAFTDIAFSRVTFVLSLLKHPFSLCWTYPSAVYLGSTEYVVISFRLWVLLLSWSPFHPLWWGYIYMRYISFIHRGILPTQISSSWLTPLVMSWFFLGPLPISFIVLFPPKLFLF